MTALAALIVGIIGPIISIYNNKKTLEKQEQMNIRNLDLQKQINISNFKGNVVSKSRIEWIQEVRKKSVDFISACYDLFEFIELHRDVVKLDAENEKEVFRLKNEIKKNGTLLILYFGPDSKKNNDLIAYFAEHLIATLTSKNLWVYRKERILLRDQVEVLKDFLRLYFKAEWKRANGEIKDSEVQAYLEKDELYIKIKKRFNKDLEEYEQIVDMYYEDVENETKAP